MCGILGILNNESGIISRDNFTQACLTLNHRGPDSNGTYFENNIALGHNRLAIIDLAGGKQPFFSQSKRYVCVFNGEIYNYKEIKSELVKMNFRFNTTSDTEVLVNAFEAWKTAAIKKFNGMFAFAIWDTQEETLFIARDGLGIKPLYYYLHNNILAFASEIKAILELDGVEKGIDEQSLWHYLTFRYVPGTESIFKHIHKLEPGYFIEINRDFEFRKNRYWNLPLKETIAADTPLPEIQNQFNTLFTNAVKRQLVADVPVGILLSGGLDSSSVMAACHALNVKYMESFSIGFDTGGCYDETPYAKEASRHLETNHHHIIIGKNEFFSFLEKFAYHTDEPVADLAGIPLYYVSKLAAQHVKVVLSGEGADEILGGYNFHRTKQMLDQSGRYKKFPGVAAIASLVSRLPHSTLKRWASFFRDSGKNYFAHNALDMTHGLYFSEQEKLRLIRLSQPITDSIQCILDPLYEEAQGFSPMNQLLYVITKNWMVEDLLIKADKMTMANSIELRVPFLDYTLVEFLFSLPIEYKVRNVGGNKYVTKYLLRQYAQKHLPEIIVNRTKQGFPVPAYSWLANEYSDYLYDILFDSTGILNQIAQKSLLLKLFKQRKILSTQHKLWSLIILSLWYKTYFNNKNV